MNKLKEPNIWKDNENYYPANFEKEDLELYYKKGYEFVTQTPDEINKYVNEMIDSKSRLNELDRSTKQAIKDKWSYIINVFNDNLSLTKYSVILLRKSPIKEELEIIKTNA